MADPKPGRGVVWGVGVGTSALVVGVVAASQTVSAIDPLYRFGREPRAPRLVAPAPARPEPVAFTPIRWPGFAAAPPAGRRDAYDDPALLAEPRPRPTAPPRPEPKLPPPEPIAPRAAPTPDAPATEPLDLPPPITAVEIGEER